MIPCSGTIKASDINTELTRPANYAFKIGNTQERALAGKPSGLIKFSDFACKSFGFTMTVGRGNKGAGSDWIGFNNQRVMGPLIGFINGNRPSEQFPAGFLGATVPFYVNELHLRAHDGNYFFWFQCSNSPSQTNYPNWTPFGNTLIMTITDSSGNSQSATLVNTGGASATYKGPDNSFLSLLTANVGQNVTVSIRAI